MTIIKKRSSGNINTAADDRIGFLQERVLSRKGIIGCSNGYTVARYENGKIFYAGENRWGQEECTGWTDVISISVAHEYVLGLLSDGTVRAAGYDSHGQLQISRFSCARSVSAGRYHSAAIIQNGRVVCAGDNSHGQCDTSEWEDVCDVVCGNDFTLGLTQNGKVLYAGGSRAMRARFSRWEKIAGLFADVSGERIYGIRADGTVVSNAYLPAEVKKWKNLVYLSVADGVYAGITLGGTVNVHGNGDLEKILSNKAEEFVTVSMSGEHSAAVNSTGQILTVGDNHFGQCDTRHQKPLFDDFTELCANMQAARRRRRQRELEYKKRECEAERFSRRMACSERISVGISAMGRVYTTGSFKDVKSWSDVTTISCGNAHILALHSDGTVSASGNNVEGCTAVSEWRGIVEILAGKYHSLALTSDGRVLFTGQNYNNQGDVSSWSGIKHIFGTDTYTLGLRVDGSVISAGRGLPCSRDVLEGDEWKNIIHIVPTDSHIAALRADGTVVTAGNASYMSRFTGCTNDWQGVKSIAAGNGFTAGLCYGGRVLAVGENAFGQCDTQNWSNVVRISAGRTSLVGLCADGKVYSAGAQRISAEQASRMFDSPNLIRGERQGVNYLRCNTDMLSDIVAITCAPEHTLAIDKGGQMFALGLDGDGQCAVSAFTMFSNISQYDKGVGYYKSRAHEQEILVSDENTAEADSADTAHGEIKRTAHENLIYDSNRYTSMIAGGDDHVTVADDEGNVRSYSFSGGVIITEPLTGKRPIKVVAGKAHSAVLYENGDVRLRESFDSQLNPAMVLPPWYNSVGLVKAVDICAGDRHTAVLLEDGTVRAMGSNKFGQCDVSALTGIKALGAGSAHTAGLTESGEVIAVGSKNREIAIKARSVAHAPVWNPCQTQRWSDVASIECTADITLGIKNDGDVLAVGGNNFGQCRTGFWHNVIDVKTSGRHTAALRADGRVEAIGCNERGECNTSEWKNIIMLALRSGVTYGLRADGQLSVAGYCDCNTNIGVAWRAVFCFGVNLVLLSAEGYLYYHRLGSKKELSRIENMRVFTPLTENGIMNRVGKVSGMTNVLNVAKEAKQRIAVGLTHALKLRPDGHVRAYGSNVAGQCDARGWEDIASLSSGLYFSVGLTASGKICSSGKDTVMSTDGNNTSRSIADELNFLLYSVDISLPQDSGGDDELDATYTLNDSQLRYVSLSAGANFAAAVRSDGRVFGVGDNSYGQCDLNRIRNAAEVACGTHHTAVLLHDGRVVCSGDNSFGQCDTQWWRNIVMLSCGENHTVGLKSDGSVVAVGDNGLSQCDVSDIAIGVSVTAMPEATLVILPGGRVVIRGGRGVMNKFVASLRETVALDACEYRIGALSSDGKLHLSDEK
ncbi:MAG: hypothetical protein IJX74_00615 [Clostridia bacterium]|nr:hypothetical protein [Clostridia bacterium]